MPGDGIHRYRRTIITLDQHLPSIIQPYVAIERAAKDMGKGIDQDVTDVAYYEGIGWRLKSYHLEFSNLFELSAANSSIVNKSNWTTIPDAVEFAAFRQNPVGSYNAGTTTSGAPVIQNRPGSGSAFNPGLAGDVAALPTPSPASDTGTMIRSLVSNNNYPPNSEFRFTFYVPGSKVSGKGTLLTFYFPGPASGNKSFTTQGSGYYALKIKADGRGILYEWIPRVNGWVKMHTFSWVGPHKNNPVGELDSVMVVNNCKESSGYPGDIICVGGLSIMNGRNSSGSYIDNLLGLAQQLLSPGLVYKVPKDTVAPSTPAKLRIDMRSDIRPIVQVSTQVYKPSGVIYDMPITVPYYATGTAEIYLVWKGDIPSGCSIIGELVDPATGVEVPGGVTTFSDSVNGVRKYPPISKQRTYRARFTLVTDASATKTPTLEGYYLYRNSISETPATTPDIVPIQTQLPEVVARHLRVTCPSKEMTNESATVVIDDIAGITNSLKSKGGVPIKIETVYNIGGSRSTLFYGYVTTAEGSQRSGHSRYAGSNRRQYHLSCSGEWTRLEEAMVPERLNQLLKPNQTYKYITDVIIELLTICYPAQMIDVPNIPLTFITKDSTNGYIIDIGTSVGQAIKELASNWLAAYMVFDPNAGSVGMWRLIQQKTPPYTPMARFYKTHPGSMKLPHVEAAYGSHVSGAQTVLHSFIRKGTQTYSRSRAENCAVVVYGGGSGNAGAATLSQGPSRISQVAVNVNSSNFLNLAPGAAGYPNVNSPDYIGRWTPMIYVDSSLTSQESVDWVCRRLYDIACHGYQVTTFESSLILVTQAGDTLQSNPRPLRFYDVVELQNDDGTFNNWVVQRVDLIIDKDSKQMAHYTLIRPTNLDVEKAVMPTFVDTGNAIFDIAINAFGGRNRAPVSTSNRKSASDHTASFMALPESTGLPLQDLNPASVTFGKFYYMAGYDPLI